MFPNSKLLERAYDTIQYDILSSLLAFWWFQDHDMVTPHSTNHNDHSRCRNPHCKRDEAHEDRKDGANDRSGADNTSARQSTVQEIRPANHTS